jgi:hypothetical protein
LVAGRTLQEIADLTDSSYSAAGVRVYRLRRRITRFLHERYERRGTSATTHHPPQTTPVGRAVSGQDSGEK